ncbi:MAG: hypothetical protein JWN45_207 [Acidobacteriaceae bacterium]|nr:hypothetical protein [Acidobacteriaceae bacterium]
MRKKSIILISATILLTLVAAAVAQTNAKPRPSPAATAEAALNGKKITIAYSQPSMRGRKIMGGLVPYDQVWRTGANDATTLKTEADLNIGGTTVPAGTYTLYSLPSAGTWKLIINKQTGQWGTEYHSEQDLARVDMKKESLSSPVETFVINFEPKTNPTAIVMEWENTKLSVPISAAK